MRTVLVVDDEFGVLDILEAVLSDAGFRVVVAGNGKQGLEILATERPDLVILDLMMPVLDGVATAKAMRDGVHANVPVIMMSGADESVLQRRFAEYQGFLRKPFRAKEVLDLVALVLKTSRPSRGNGAAPNGPASAGKNAIREERS